ncbi:TIGR01777 family oxidoreductase [Salipaludibacillus sp. CUR1]|uniref:TIGR01777 family oxidoreductase n=1 Tax=Salipaludibacillus sp. CUR1 TaxID=2820003 RepID=UPI001E337CF0|nr:TIGR01777 family oxidoreductase [Salipaludibacillus sp. CUR1]MCE7792247.1 TIGR01777 family oxidoreductase [Salipaludibacillus sp. CUR1]
MKVSIAGGSGLIGQAVTKELLSEGHQVVILTRNKSNKKESDGISYVEWLKKDAFPEKELEGVDAMINLAGENLNSGRWTSDKKKEILDSRIDATRETVRIMENLEQKPSVLINGSAVGFYDSSYSKTYTEDDREAGDGFLADVVKQWEEEALKAPSGVRVVCTRFGIVLSAEEGALKKMLPPFKMGAGGKLGTGEQWMSWIHIEDVAKALAYCVTNKDIQGPVNFTAPNPEKMKNFGKTLADVLNRPFWAPVPSTVLHIVLGEMSMLVLEGQRVLPKKLQENGYTFTYPHLKEALNDLLKK